MWIHKVVMKNNITKYGSTLYTSGKNHFHEMNGDVGMAGWR